MTVFLGFLDLKLRLRLWVDSFSLLCYYKARNNKVRTSDVRRLSLFLVKT